MPYRPRVGDLVLDKSSVVPLYLQLKQHLIHLISYGTWQPNALVPSVRQLATDLRMATATVQRVYNELQAEGLLVGQPGRGVYVANLASGIPVRTEERGEILRALFARPISHARSLGFADEELLAAIDAVAGLAATPSRPPRVVFVGTSAASVRKYPPLLRKALGPLGLAVDGALFSDVERDECVLDALEPIRMIVALVGSYPHLREVAARRGVPIFGLVVELAETTQRALIDLPPEGDVALIGQQVYLPSARALLRQYFVRDDRVRTALPTNVPLVGRLVRACPIVVHTLAATDVVRRHAPPSARTIELEYRPNPASLARLTDLLATEVAGARAEAVGAAG